MTARFLLDTNIVSDLVRRPQGPVAAAIAGVGKSLVRTSVVVAAELRYAAAKKGSPRLSQQLDAVLGAMAVLALKSPADRFYGDIRADLERSGLLIGPNDPLSPPTLWPLVASWSRTMSGNLAASEACRLRTGFAAEPDPPARDTRCGPAPAAARHGLGTEHSGEVRDRGEQHAGSWIALGRNPQTILDDHPELEPDDIRPSLGSSQASITESVS